METSQPIQIDQRNGNLHGQFTPKLAIALTSAIARDYQGKGNIFIHTSHITAVAPESRGAFANNASMLGLPQEKMYLTGIKGLDISPDKGRVIVYDKKKKGGCGRCSNCKCHDKH